MLQPHSSCAGHSSAVDQQAMDTCNYTTSNPRDNLGYTALQFSFNDGRESQARRSDRKSNIAASVISSASEYSTCRRAAVVSEYQGKRCRTD